jgi:hypothetical protein
MKTVVFSLAQREKMEMGQTSHAKPIAAPNEVNFDI